jgi:hypothetical protein
LAAAVLSKVKGEVPVSASEEIAQLSPLLAGISRRLPYSVPDNFFQSNIENSEAFTSENEESLVLSFISKEMPYKVPTGYFANFPETVVEKLSDRGTKVVPMVKRKWMRLAIAATVTGIMAISGFFYFNNRGANTTTDPVTAVKKASTEELNDFIKSTVVNVTGNNVPVTAKNTTETKKLFNDVSDKELDAFLSQMPTDNEDIDIN